MSHALFELAKGVSALDSVRSAMGAFMIPGHSRQSRGMCGSASLDVIGRDSLSERCKQHFEDAVRHMPQ
jgi:hypothetical protein